MDRKRGEQTEEEGERGTMVDITYFVNVLLITIFAESSPLPRAPGDPVGQGTELNSTEHLDL